MKTQTVTIEWHEYTKGTKLNGVYLAEWSSGIIMQEFIDTRYSDSCEAATLVRYAKPIEYKPDAVDTVQLLDQAVRELSAMIHLFNIRAKKERDKSSLDDVELLDYQTVSELEQLAEKLKINKLEQWR